MREKTVSIVDDDIGHVALLKLLLKIGYTADGILRYPSLSCLISAGAETALLLVSVTGLAVFYQQLDENKELFSNTAIILISSIDDTEHIKAAFSRGIQDHITSSLLDEHILERSILYAVERKQNEIRKCNDAYDNSFFVVSPTPMWIYNDETFQIVAVNDSAIRSYGYSRNEFLQKSIFDLRPAEELPALKKAIGIKKSARICHDTGIWKHIKKDRTIFYTHVYSYHTYIKGHSSRLIIAIDVHEQLIVEQQLKEKESEVKNILETITDAFYTVDNDWNITYINKETEKLYQIEKENYIGTNLWDVFPNSKSTGFYPEYIKAMTGRVSVHFKEYAPSVHKWIQVNAYPTKDGLAIYHTDITEQKKLEEKIAADQQDLLAIINNTNDIIWSIDTGYNVTIANNAYYERVKKIANNTDYNAITATDIDQKLIDEWNGYYKRAFDGEQFKIVFRSEVNGIDRYEQINFNPILDSNNMLTGINFFSRDITEEKKLEEKIITEKRNLFALINNTTDMIWSVDKNMDLISANHAYKAFIFKLCNVNQDAGNSAVVTDVDCELLKRWAQYYHKALEGPFDVIDEELVNGNKIYLETFFNTIANADGNIIGVSCFSRNITLQREQMIKIRSQNDKLREIAWMQSHQVRGPLSTIMGLTQLFNTADTTDPLNAQVISGIIETTASLDDMIRAVVKKTYDVMPNE